MAIAYGSRWGATGSDLLQETPSVTPSLTQGLTEAAIAELIEQEVGQVDHAPDSAVAPAATGDPVVSEIQAWVSAQTLKSTLVYYTGTDLDSDTPTRLYEVDNLGIARQVWSTTASQPETHTHLTATLVAASNVAKPTIAEIQARVTAAAIIGAHVYYTGTDTATDPITRTYSVDDAGLVIPALGATIGGGWIYSTDGMNAVDGDKIIVAPNHSINLPGVTDLQEIQFAPATGDWADIYSGTGGFFPDAAWTYAIGQMLEFGSDVHRAVSVLGSTNWRVFTGGEEVPQMDERVATILLLPNPTTVNSGTAAIVYDDPTPANNRLYVARGAAGANAVAWS